MPFPAAEAGRAAANHGIDAVRDGRRADAGTLFLQALDSYETIPDDAARREELGDLAHVLNRVGFPDLALMAAEDAVAIDRTLANQRALMNDLVTRGNAQMQMGNLGDAEISYREALSVALENDYYGDAASASTNLAVVIGNTGRMADAISLMRDSLGYLERERHDDTEIITRIALTQALEAEDEDPEEIFAVAEPAYERFLDQLRPDQRDGLREPLKSAAARYAAARPGSDAATVMAERFPGLAG